MHTALVSLIRNSKILRMRLEPARVTCLAPPLMKRLAPSLMALLMAMLMAPAGAADVPPEVTLVGLFPNRALVSIDRGAPRILAIGQTVAGVRLLAVSSENAVVEIQGQQRTLQIGQAFVGEAGANAGAGQVTLRAEAGGHYFANVLINGGTLRMLVDTGATTLAITAQDARRLGLDYLSAPRVGTNTANGTSSGYRLRLDTVAMGGIVLHGVDAIVSEGGLPFGLLGMSFLGRTSMQRDGDTMTLTKRY